MIPRYVPDAVFHTRVRNPALDGDNPFEWQNLTTDDVFAGKRIVLFAVPGAFTPACSDSHLPGFERLHDEFLAEGIDRVICVSVNDAFVLYQWGLSREISKVHMLPDGNGEFTRKMGMLVERSNHGMGMRSWRYSALVKDRMIAKFFAEPQFRDNPAGVPLDVSSAETILEEIRRG
ncbi:Putative peroxiredoxin [Jannaschia seosinensis]|uniref:Glutathione-dependent peroxiredoxin n=1 Tax=Jannaschia seosinensis TaxID=313367 RepID=A0A0M7B8P7_9RHOB|nr:peroxiredoxin [Jannaschia seosinensis]CUH31116.1 Putative peroxiredoxin [Jannaschia seosinensis]